MREKYLKKKTRGKGKMGNRGFTLIELLVVISIIAVLSSVVMASLQAGRQKAYDAQIVSDMTQMRSALELYANDHGYKYPLVSELAQNQNAHEDSPVPMLSTILGSRAYASGRNQNCVYFDNLASKLSPYIGKIPRYPLDDGGDACYKYFSSDSGDAAVAYGSSVLEKYSDGTNKQVGIAMGRTDIASLQAICNDNLSSGILISGSSAPFPLFSGGGADKCSGVVADKVIGVTSGEGDVTFEDTCDGDPLCSSSGYLGQ